MGTQRNWSFNWRTSPAHLALLTTFLSPRLQNENPTNIDWTMVLGETSGSAVERFFVHGALVSFYPTRELLEQFTVNFLKHLLRSSGLAVSGRKEELVSRVLEAKIQLAACTDYGRKFAEPYLANPEARPAAGFTVEMVESLFKWLSTTVVSGVIGNAVYDTIKKVLENRFDSQLPEPVEDFDFKVRVSHSVPPSSTQSFFEDIESTVSYFDAENFFLLADEQFSQGNYRQAIKFYTEAIEAYPHFGAAFNNRAIAHQKLGQYRQALSDYNQAINISSYMPKRYYNRSVTYFHLNERKRQIADLSEAIRLDPRYTQAYVDRANAYYALGDYKRAVADYSEAAKLGDRSAKKMLKDLQSWIKTRSEKRSNRR